MNIHTHRYYDEIVHVEARVYATDNGYMQITLTKPDDVMRTLAVRIAGADLDVFVDQMVAARDAIRAAVR